jgi:hypothetical protein
VLKNIEISLASLVQDFNGKTPTSLVKATRKAFEACFVRKGESKKRGGKKPERVSQSVLECANDWKLLVDFDAKKAEFPPSILATRQRPDIVLWSQMSRVVVLIELTCCAEEGIGAANLRKEAKYTELVSEINNTNVWKASLFTLEIGARGLVGLSTHKIFVRLGFTSPQAKALCKKLSSVVVRCSFAVYQAHSNLAWSHGTDLIVAESSPAGRVQDCQVVEVQESSQEPPCKSNNVRTLRDNGVQSLFHFTDVSNLQSISKNGLLTWKKLAELKVPAKMNSSELSHKLDSNKGLADFVRLSFCKKHPMMYIALKEKRISTAVVLEIKLETVSRPGVLFCAINAAAKAAKASANPRVVRFEVVKARSQQHVVDLKDRPFYQGEVLVPEWIPPHLIKIPNVDAFNRPLELRGRLPDSNLVECTLRGEMRGAGLSSSTPCNNQKIAAGAGSSTPEPRVLPIEVHSAGNGKSSHETFAAPKTLGRMREVPWASDLKTELQRERWEKLFSLVDPYHMLQCEQFSWSLDKVNAFLSNPPKAKPEVEEKACGCQMPLSRSASCDDCISLGGLVNCRAHMQLCTAPVFLACGNCLRQLCWEHIGCYCVTKIVGNRGAAEREKGKARARAKQRETEEREREKEWK